MKFDVKKLIIFSICMYRMMLAGHGIASSGGHADIIVDQNHHGDYLTITEAVEALPMYPYQRIIILVKNGIYKEKLRIEQNYITLRGEDRDNTIIRYSQLRTDWNKNKDYIGPAVVNIHGDDVVLDNLTVENTQPEIGPHAFTVLGDGTRTIITNCNVISKGGDTVALWNYKQGMYYHANCTFQGAVDLVCPRGWCFIRDSEFYEVKQTAALWHAGFYNPDQKFVIRNSYFDGQEGFQLGRHHYEAQFYLLDCRFSIRIADQPIYRYVNKDLCKSNPNYNGDRNYFYNCRKEGTNYGWYENNLDEIASSINPEQITPAWTFDNQWDPECQRPLKIINHVIKEKSLILTFDEIVTVRGEPIIQNKSRKQFQIVIQRFNDIDKLTFISDSKIHEEDLVGEFVLLKGDIIASIACVHERSVGSKFKLLTASVIH